MLVKDEIFYNLCILSKLIKRNKILNHMMIEKKIYQQIAIYCIFQYEIVQTVEFC